MTALHRRVLRAVLFAATLLWMTQSAVLAQGGGALPSRDGLRQAYQPTLTNADRYLATWTTEQRLQVLFAIAITALGILTAALQKSDGPMWKRVGIGVALSISVLTGVKEILFKIDYHTLARKKQIVLTSADVIRNNLGLYDDSWPVGDRKTLKDEIEKKAAVIRDTADEVNPQLVWAVHLPDVMPVAYASSTKAAWLSSPPPDGDSLFAVGQASGPTLDGAKKQALENGWQALAAKSARLWQSPAQQKGGSAPALADLKRYIEKVSTVADTNLTYDAGARAFSYAVLLKVAASMVNTATFNALHDATPAGGAPIKKPAAMVLVTPEFKLRQFRKQVLSDAEFGGSVTVYAGELRSNDSGEPSRLLIFHTGKESWQWKDGARIPYDELKQLLSPTQVIAEVEVYEGTKTTFMLGGKEYVADITRLEGTGLTQYMRLKIFKE